MGNGGGYASRQRPHQNRVPEDTGPVASPTAPVRADSKPDQPRWAHDLARAASTARLSGWGAMAGGSVVQRKVELDGKTYAASDGHSVYRKLYNALDHHIRSKGWNFSAKAHGQVATWLGGDDVKPRPFTDLDDLVGELNKLGLLWKRASGPSLGPTKLGDRPAFKGAANQLDRNPGEARRHVISSSTLGTAIERTPTSVIQVRAFLVRHQSALGGYGLEIPDVGGNLDLHLAHLRRVAWELVHNHVGNLWMGPTDENSAIGFMRSAVLKAKLMLQGKEAKVKKQEVLALIEQPQGPLDLAGQAAWKRVFQQISDLIGADDHGDVDSIQAVEMLTYIQRQLDVDMPPDSTSGTYQTVGEIYAQLLAADEVDLFASGGALDAFMKLHHTFKLKG